MTLGPRLALATTLLVAVALGLASWALLRLRAAELEEGVREEARQVAVTVAAALEPVEGRETDAELDERLRRVTSADGAYTLSVLSAGDFRTEDTGWRQLVDAATFQDAPVGRLFTPSDRPPFFAMAVPLHNFRAGDPARRVVAVVGLQRPADAIGARVRATAWRVLPLAGAAVASFGIVILLLLRGGVVGPLRRLVEGIDAVSQGDFSRALLPERDDEIGQLSARFNEMTNSLRRAREQEARETAARSTLETRLRQSEKLATMGQMAAEIAHEVGTPLNVIGGRARALAKRANDPAEVLKNAEIIGSQVERITKIIRQVLAFSRKSRPTLTQVDVARVAREAVGFLEETLRRQSVEVELRLRDDLPAIPGDPDEIQQVCLNLITNALHAMPKGGWLTISAAEVLRRKEGLALAAPAPYLLLEFADTGAGVPSADRERIFEPFFTTKETGEGTGLGLAVSKGIVKDHDGWLEVDDRPEGGAVFRVFLPTARDTTGAGASF